MQHAFLKKAGLRRFLGTGFRFHGTSRPPEGSRSRGFERNENLHLTKTEGGVH